MKLHLVLGGIIMIHLYRSHWDQMLESKTWRLKDWYLGDLVKCMDQLTHCKDRAINMYQSPLPEKLVPFLKIHFTKICWSAVHVNLTLLGTVTEKKCFVIEIYGKNKLINSIYIYIYIL